MMKNKRFFKILLLCALACAGLGGLSFVALRSGGATESGAASFQPLDLPADIVTPFAAQFEGADRATEHKTLPAGVFVTLDGDEKTFADFNGLPTLVNFWATWCAPCVVELPYLQKLADHYDGKMNVVAVALEAGRPAAEIAAFLENRQIGAFAGFQDAAGTLAGGLMLRGLPTTFLLGPDGTILYRLEGDADWTSEATRNFFDAFFLSQR